MKRKGKLTFTIAAAISILLGITALTYMSVRLTEVSDLIEKSALARFAVVIGIFFSVIGLCVSALITWFGFSKKAGLNKVGSIMAIVFGSLGLFSFVITRAEVYALTMGLIQGFNSIALLTGGIIYISSKE
ncbi:hypothetical protein SCHIN_v1c01310 [Spiroplasma chinense]|uniref:Uncharacterized protein n=1 Tax=Spiroplasma chinense TaxID=216932 RepID=A0A5B9Y3S5_9MOLU|nr:hypothetical protein [Spiroplasma chinense]QEH61329.1 hypothetical protein SCHIN_v1c01310 [Spiroplasma chinense]